MVLESPFEVPLISASPSCIFEWTQWMLKKVFRRLNEPVFSLICRQSCGVLNELIHMTAAMICITSSSGNKLVLEMTVQHLSPPTHTHTHTHTHKHIHSILTQTCAWAHTVTHCYSNILSSETISFPGFDCSTKSWVTHAAAFQRRHYMNNQFVWQQNNCSLDRQIYYN